MEEDKWSGVFHGESYAETEAYFKAELERIEKVYAEWFQSRPPHIMNMEYGYDKICNHYVIYIKGDTVHFNLYPGSDEILPPEIQYEIFNAFETYFPKK